MQVGIGQIDQVELVNGDWVNRIRMNGDQSHHLHIPQGPSLFKE